MANLSGDITVRTAPVIVYPVIVHPTISRLKNNLPAHNKPAAKHIKSKINNQTSPAESLTEPQKKCKHYKAWIQIESATTPSPLSTILLSPCITFLIGVCSYQCKPVQFCIFNRESIPFTYILQKHLILAVSRCQPIQYALDFSHHILDGLLSFRKIPKTSTPVINRTVYLLILYLYFSVKMIHLLCLTRSNDSGTRMSSTN